jgi:hypothetical protein
MDDYGTQQHNIGNDRLIPTWLGIIPRAPPQHPKRLLTNIFSDFHEKLIISGGSAPAPPHPLLPVGRWGSPELRLLIVVGKYYY